MKFRKHNVEHAIEEANERSHKAASKSDLWTNVWWAEGAILHLQAILEYGLFDCYKDMKDFLIDFYPSDLPWNKKQCDQVISLILQDSRWPTLQEGFLTEWNLDLTKLLSQ